MCWCPLKEAQEPFTLDELTKLDWAWFSRPVGDGTWIGVALKGVPHISWVTGIIPHFPEDDEGLETTGK